MKITKNADRQLRSFGVTVGGVFELIGWWPLLRHHPNPRLWAVLLGLALILPGIVMPRILKKPHQFWMQLAHVLGWINSRIILSVMFYAVFTPAAMIARLIQKDPMNRAFVPGIDSYRVIRRARNAEHMKHQF
jgi:hypothetical protein